MKLRPYVLLAACCMVTSCAEDLVVEESVKIHSQEQTINSRNVKQTRGSLNRAVAASDVRLARAEYHLGMASRAVGLLRTFQHTKLKDGMCVPGYTDAGPGDVLASASSGVLSSDSRFVVAAHAALSPAQGPPPPPNSPHTPETELYRVSFGGSQTPLLYSPTGRSLEGNLHPPLDTIGKFVNDYSLEFNTRFPAYPDPAEDLYGYATREEEDPLLAHRLFAMGLESWAVRDDRNAFETRTRLRTSWPFAIDAVNAAANSSFVDLVKSQGLLDTVPSGHWRGDDIMILKALEHDHFFWNPEPGQVGYLPSGRFLLDRPAMFFNQVMFQAGFSDSKRQGERYEVKANERILMLHYQDWPDQVTTPVRKSPLVSYPGVVRMQYEDTYFVKSYPNGWPGVWDLGAGQTTCEPLANTLRVLRSRTKHNFMHTCDGGPGSSGGAILSRFHPSTYKDPSDLRALMESLYSHVTFLLSAQGVHTAGASVNAGEGGVKDKLPQGWRPVPLADELNNPAGFQGSPTKDNTYKVGTWLNELAAALARRDHPGQGTEDDPKPEQNVPRPGPLLYEQQGYSSIEQGFDPEARVAPSHPDEENFINQARWAEGSVDGEGAPGATGPGAPQPPNPGQPPNSRREILKQIYHCDKSLSWVRSAYHEGMMVGLVGIQISPPDKDPNDISLTYLGGLGSICAPWSDVSWSDHWRFVNVNTLDWFERDGRTARNAWPGRLVDFLTRAFIKLTPPQAEDLDRLRNIPATGVTEIQEYQVRPVPMKMCPPNYVMSSMRAIVHGGVVKGIDRLRCVRNIPDSQNLALPKTLEVSMTTGSEHQGYTMTANNEIKSVGTPAKRGIDAQGDKVYSFPLRQDIGMVHPALVANLPGVARRWVGCTDPDSMVISALQIHYDRATREIVSLMPACRVLP